MAYNAGDTILDDEYNTFVDSSSSPYGYNHFAGTGSAEYGLGQTHIAVTSAGATIQASQWNSLFTAMDNIANHTNDTLTSRSLVSAGDTIAIKAAVEADLATLAASVAAGSPNATAISSQAAGASTNAGTWTGTSTIERSITFSDADKMRHFFNAGGYIQVTPTTSGTTDGDKDTAFADLCTAFGNIDIKAQSSDRGGSGETLTEDGLSNGFHNLSTSYTTILKLTSDNSGYTANTLEVAAKLDAAVGTAVTITIKLAAVDGADDDTYDPNNPITPGGVEDPNQAPAMVLTLTEFYPDNTEGLSANIQSTSNAEVSNTTT